MPIQPTSAPRTERQQSAFGNWDLRRDNISRPTEGQLDRQLTMSRFSEQVEEDDELDTPPFFRNR
jgi:cell division protein FtsZ